MSEVIAPLSGEILAVNGKVVEDPETINAEPYDEGWLIRVRVSDAGELDELLDVDAYRKLLESL